MTTTTATTKVTYRKTKTGEWVAFGPTHSLSVGQIAVTKKDGSTKIEVVTRLGHPFTVDGVECAYGYLAPSNRTAAASSASRRSWNINNTCEYCEDGMSFGLRGGSRCSHCGGEIS